MDNIKSVGTAGAVAGVVAAAVLLLIGVQGPAGVPGPAGRDGSSTFAGLASPDVHSWMNVHGALQWGGGNFATTSTGASTLAWSDIDQVGTITRAGVALTMTLPASTTVTGLQNPGDCRDIVILNTGTGILTTAAGTGIILDAGSTTRIFASGSALTTWCRRSDTDIAVIQHQAE